MPRWRLFLGADYEVLGTEDSSQFAPVTYTPPATPCLYTLGIESIRARYPHLDIDSVFCATTQDELGAYAEWLKWKEEHL